MECHGVPEYVIVGGRVCLDEGNLKVVQGHGKFVPTRTHSDFVYNNGKVHILSNSKKRIIEAKKCYR